MTLSLRFASAIQLREHQVDANSRIRKWVGFPSNNPVPEHGARATMVSATGSGKTYTAAAAALDRFRNGRILVMVPTLDLLVQTAQAWRTIGHRSPMVAVCSLEKDEVLEQLGVRTTTNPVQLALWAGSGPVIVLATYASLVDRDDPRQPPAYVAPYAGSKPEREEPKKIRGPIEQALAGGELLYGQTMAPFDLAVVDEAHGTAGDLGRPWAAIHDQQRIQADFRLYLTATPRILAAPRPQKDKDGQEVEIASMTSDPDGPYGTRIVDLGLSEAIERGVLAGFAIDVIEIRDPEPILGLSEEALRGRRQALLQTALLEHAAAHNLRTMMTFHQRVEEAAAFAEKLPETAAELYATEASDTFLEDAAALPPSSLGAKPYELEPYRHVPADRVWANWLCGDHFVSERREVLRQFANGIDADGKRVHRAFLASVRVLGEGVDIVGERGVEAICFADTRGSQVEIVQNIGRALRPNLDGATKVARIIVPVFLAPGEDPDDMVASASFRPLVAVLAGLRSHDERLVEQLASRALSRGREQRHIHVERDADGRIIGAGECEGDGEEGQEQGEAAVESALLHFSSPRDAATIAAFLRTRIYRPESLVWLEGYQALRRWRRLHHHTGLYAVPYDTEVPLGVTVFPLGRWVHQQRRAYRANELDTHRKEQLDAADAGMVWEPGDEAWETKLAALRSYHRAHHHLAPRQDAIWGQTEADQQPVGQHMANLRRKGGLGKNPERAENRAQQLTAIDPDWDCPWPLDWQRHHRVLRELATDESEGRLPDIQPGVMVEGDDLGRWIQRQAHNWAQLSAAQQERLTGLGITPTQRPSAAPARKGADAGPGSAAFTRGVAALKQYIAREGAGKPVPRGHSEEIAVDGEAEPVSVRLGVFLSNTKTRRDKLTAPQRTALAELGVEWA
ncbi:Helicase associated domain protein [Streptomyces sp. 21So2-11]|uniref:DEAD/DEAH box helicase n=1 Tax=Streptomyces sp. 21So2-11 TaxID=3144408 RepID=UPI003219753D